MALHTASGRTCETRGYGLALAASLALVLVAGNALAQFPANVALGRPYALEPAPNYPPCTDPGDTTQLTDGIKTDANFWTQKTTVGWVRQSPVTITIDLGRVTPIEGVSFRTAAGKAGVEWPAAIDVFASDDGSAFYPLGDLVSLSDAANGPPGPGYRIFTYATQALRGHGRYVRFVVAATWPFVFSDEIEVYAGPASWVKEPMARRAVRDTKAFSEQSLTQRRVMAALRRDIALARQRVEASAAAAAERARFRMELDQLDKQVSNLPEIDVATFRAVLPMGPVHAAIFSLIGQIDAAAGQPALAAWSANPWDFLTPVDAAPVSPAPPPELSLLRGETRAAAVNVRNATANPTTVNLKITGLPAKDAVTAASVAWTETQQGVAVAAALVDAPRQNDGFVIDVPAGMTRQIWLRVSSASLPPGQHTAKLSIRAPGREPIELSLRLSIVAASFPAKPRLHVGGWDYTNTDTTYGVTPDNVTPLLAQLRNHSVDSPWATSAALPFGSFDASGHMTASPDTANFDRWLFRWPNARRYMVFLDVKDAIGAVPTGSASFDRAVQAWLQFWTTHATKRGVRPEQIHLLLVDEPHEATATARILSWARAIHSAGTDVQIWEDPIFASPQAIPPELLGAVDVVCLDRRLGARAGDSFWYAAAKLRSPSRRLELYGTSGNVPMLDPYSYYRLQAWQAFAIGGDGSSFWSFADNRDVHPWNELSSTNEGFSPLFLAHDSVTSTKQMEAIVESVHDFEILSMLRDAVERAGDSGASPDLAGARALLRDGPVRALGADGANDFFWSKSKDRSVADDVRREAAALLDRLASRAR